MLEALGSTRYILTLSLRPPVNSATSQSDLLSLLNDSDYQPVYISPRSPGLALRRKSARAWIFSEYTIIFSSLSASHTALERKLPMSASR